MSIIKLIIADENENYVKGLSEYLIEEYSKVFDICCFTRFDILHEYLTKGISADILLISSTLYQSLFPVENIKIITQLEEALNKSANGNDTIIYKYQTGNQIAKRLLELFDKELDNNIKLDKSPAQTKLLCVYSSAGGDGKTTIAYNLAYQYALQSCRVLFVSIESYASPIMNSLDERKYGLMYFVYMIKSKQSNLQLKLDNLKHIDIDTNIHFIPREQNSLEYKDIKQEDMELFFNFVKDQSGYDIAIIDLDSSLNEVVLGAFKHCDRVLRICTDDVFSKSKAVDFDNQIDKLSQFIGVDLMGKLIQVNNKKSLVEENSWEQNALGSQINEIPYIQKGWLHDTSLFPEMKHFKNLMDAVEKSFK